MKVFVDVVGARTGGAITVSQMLLRRLAQQLPHWSFEVCLLPEAIPSIAPKTESRNIQFTPIPWARGPLLRIWWQQVALPALARRQHADVILSFVNIAAYISAVPTVIYFHQSLYFFKDAGWNPPLIGRCKILLGRMFVLLGFRNARFVVAQTKAVREAILAQSNLPPERIAAIHTGEPDGNSPSEADLALQQRVSGTLGSFSPPIAIYLSHPTHYKNFDLLFRSACRMKETHTPGSFALTLDKHRKGDELYNTLIRQYEARIQELDIGDRVIFIGSLPPNVVPGVLEKCQALVFPSLIESFPQPLTEAMSVGLPLLLADRPYAREIGGDAALFFDPVDDGSSLAELLRVISVDVERVKSLREASLRRGSDFSYAKAAEEIAGVLMKAARHKKP